MISSNPRRSGFPIEAFGNDGRGQLGQIVSDDDATCDAPNRGVYPYVEVMEHRMLLSQRREMPQLHTKIPEGLDTPRGFVAFNGAPDKI